MRPLVVLQANTGDSRIVSVEKVEEQEEQEEQVVSTARLVSSLQKQCSALYFRRRSKESGSRRSARSKSSRSGKVSSTSHKNGNCSHFKPPVVPMFSRRGG